MGSRGEVRSNEVVVQSEVRVEASQEGHRSIGWGMREVFLIGLLALHPVVSSQAEPWVAGAPNPPTDARQVDTFGRMILDEDGQKINYDQFESEEAAASFRGVEEATRRAIEGNREAFRAPPGDKLESPVPVQLEWNRGVFGRGIGSAGLEVADLDGDGVPEIIANSVGSLSTWYVLHEVNGGYAQVWVSLPLTGNINSLRAMDIDGDGADEVLIGTGNQVQVYQGLAPSLSQTIVTAASEVRALEVVDLDSDGALELVFLDSSNLFVYDLATGTSELQVPGLGGYDLAVGNVDGDADLEIAVAGISSGLVVNGLTGITEWTSPNGFSRDVAVGDLDGDGIDEVATARSWNDVEVYDVDLGTLAWSTPVGLDVAALELRDVEGDGDLELLYGDAQWGSVHVHDGASGALEWSRSNPSHGITNIEVADVDLDGDAELLWGAGFSSSGADYLFVADTVTLALEWQNLDLIGPFLGLDHGDVDADGAPELLSSCFESESGSGDGLYFVHDAASKSLEFVSDEPTGADFSGSWRVRQAQVDGDPQAEIFFTSGSGYSGKIFAYDGLTHLEEWQVTIESGLNFRSLEVVDVDADGALEVVASTGRLHTGPAGVYLFIFDAASGALEWQSPILNTSFSSYSLLRIADVDADAALEILVGRAGGELQIFDGANHVQELNVALNLSALDTADLDGDGQDEILVGSSGGALTILDPATGASVETIGNFGSAIEGLAVVDLDFDGWLDYVFGSADEVRLVDGLSHSLVWSSGVLGSAVGANDSLLVADIDEDGKREIVVNTGIGIRVYEVGFLFQTPPQVTITAPSAGAVFVEGEMITLSGLADDAEDGDLTTSLAWSSDIDGVLGNGGSLQLSNLSVGVHNLTATVVDSSGLSDSTSVSITVDSLLVVGLAGHWPLDEGAGSLAADASGNGYDGTLAGDPLWTSGVLSGGLDLDGQDDAIAFGATPRLDQPLAVTLAAWVRHSPSGAFHSIFDKRDGGSDGYDLYLNNAGRLFLRVNNATLIGNTIVADDTWHHVVGVYDGSQALLYVDGALDASATFGSLTIDTTAALRIAHHFSSNDFRFDGTLDDARIYDRALSGNEVDALYLVQGMPDTRPPVRIALAPTGALDAGTTAVELSVETRELATCRYDTSAGISFAAMSEVFGSVDSLHHSAPFTVSEGTSYTFYVRCIDTAGNANEDDKVISFSVAATVDLSTGLMGYWPLDDGVGAVASDASGNGYDGTLVDSPQWTAGQFGGGLSLDGQDDGVTCAAAPGLDQPTTLTLAAWIQHPANSGFRSIIDKRDGGADGYDLYLNNTSRLFLRVNGSTLAGQTALDDGTWHQVVGVWDGSSLAVFVDGALDGFVTIPATSVQTNAALRLGHHFADGNFRFGGSLDEVRVYDRAFSASEVQSLFELQVP